jgi:hypothetical protein
VIPDLAAYRDHVTLVAHKGSPAESLAVPGLATPGERWPERLPLVAHPAQGRRYRLLERLRRARGGGLPRVFRTHG